MKKLLDALVHPVLLALLGVLAFAGVVWWIGPLVSIGNWKPLAAWWVRLTWIVLAAALVFGRMAWRYWSRKRAEQALAAGIAAAPPRPGEKDVENIRESFARAVGMLRRQHQGPFWQRHSLLYDLPWYIFVGDSGSGKTTALLNAGLRFPLAAKMGQDKVEVKGVGGTRNCDWWFSDEAVLIDTAGRYSTQQSDAAADAAGWQGFLALLKRHRPLRPINGVLLIIDAQSLLQQGSAERQQVAAQLRARVQELNDELGIRAPVYVLVTKSDLIAGFNETFQDLGKEEREQAFGFSLPLQAQGDVLAAFDAEYGLLVQRLCAQMIDRMQAERDPVVRAAIFSFPQQFAALQPVLGEMLREIFAGEGRIDAPAFVRGVYFTCGKQEGTPIDRVLGTLARAFGVEARAGAMAPGTGKSYFLHRVLRDVVFAEQGLVGFNRKVERSRSVLRVAGLAMLAVCGALLLIGWGFSSWSNSQYVRLVEARLPELRRTVEAVSVAETGDVTGIAGTLSAVRSGATPIDFALDAPPLLNTLGLYQGDKLDEAAATGYRNVLRHAMLPRLTQRSEELLRSASRNDLEYAYFALRGYLMLHVPARFDAAALRDWVHFDWNQQLQGRLSVEQRVQLDRHLDALLTLGPPERVPPMNQPLVDSARHMLAALPTEARVYSQLKRRRLDQNLPEFAVARAAGPRAAQVFERASGAPLSNGVPALYTFAGYHDAFNPAIPKAVEEILEEESWVLGIASNPGRSLAGRDAPVIEAVRRLYLDDYIRVWDRYLADVRLVRLGDIDRSVQIAALLASPESPFTAYMREVVKETRLVKVERQAPAAPGKVEQKIGGAINKVEQLLSGSPAPAPRLQGRPEQRVDEHFGALHRLTEGQPTGLDALQKKFEDIFLYLQAVKEARNSNAPPPAGGPPVGTAALQPEPVRSVLLALANAGRKESADSDRKSLTSELRPIAEDCQRSIAGRYPFASGSQTDVLLGDFERLFGTGRDSLDEFFQRRLTTRVDKGTQPWSYRPLPDGTREPTPAAVVDFQRASRIREVFFSQGAKSPSFRLDIRASELQDGLTGIDLDVDGQVQKLGLGAPAIAFAWPSSRVDSEIRLTGQPAGTTQSFRGPWALFRMFDRYDTQPMQRPEKYRVLLNLDGRRATLEVTATSVSHPYRLREMQQFRCPGAL